MDTIDVGGAGANGRPDMPQMITVDESGGAVDDGKYKQAPVEQKKVEPSIKVRRAVESTPMGGASAAYPDKHPANREDIEQTSDGGLKITKDTDTRRFDLHKPLGDIREGYVTGARDDPRNSGGTPAATVESSLKDLQAEMANAGVTAEHNDDVKLTAHNDAGAPLIEVLFHLDIGIIASYHTQVVEQGKWLVFIDDTRQPAKQKFIPNPTADADFVDITITGSDKYQQKRRIRPLGINFTVQNYDFFVTMLVSMPEE